MDDEQLTLIGIQQIILDESIRALYYSRKYHGLERTDFNKFSGACFTKVLIVQWCQLFGNRAEDIHWSKLELANEYPQFDRQTILDVTEYSFPEWEEYHGNIKGIRDKFFAHFDLDQLRGNVPDFEPALSVLLAYRHHLIEVIEHANEQGQLINRNFDDNQVLIGNIEEELDW